MKDIDSEKHVRIPSVAVSAIPVISLIVLMLINFRLGEDAVPGSMVMFLCAVLTALIAQFYCRVSWAKLEKGILAAIDMSMPAILIIFLVGGLISAWVAAGIVPMLIYYGLAILSSTGFLFVCCIICAVVAICTGSSWSTAGTVGLALMGVGTALGIPEGMTAGAIVSGAFFGDKMSPMSDSTNLAPAMVGTDVFTHIRHMVYTSGPAIIISLIAYLIIGFAYQGPGADTDNIIRIQQLIQNEFEISLWLLAIPVIVVVSVARGLPPMPALTLGTFLAIAAVPLFQADMLARQIGADLSIANVYSYLFGSLASGYQIETGDALIDRLFNRGGMLSMLELNFLVTAAMTFGGLLEASGMLASLTRGILSGVQTIAGLVATTLSTCILVNLTASNQTMAIIIPARMFADAFKRFNLHPKNLSRACEDAGTVVAPLIPWNTNGVYCAGVLGVATTSYLPFAFFCFVSPIVSMFLAATDKTMTRLESDVDFQHQTEQSA